MPKKNAVDKLIDYAFYAPIGALKIASDAIAHASEVGKATYDSKTSMAKAVGKMAAEYGSRQIENQISITKQQLKDRYTKKESPRPAEANTSTHNIHESNIRDKQSEAHENNINSDFTEIAGLSIDSEELGISSYDTLAASQVISRLDGLNKDQLTSVFDYEKHHRKRRTVLAKLEAMLA